MDEVEDDGSAPSALHHAPCRFLASDEGRFQVDVQHLGQGFVRHLHGWAGAPNAVVDDGDVEAAEACDGGLEQAAALGAAGGIEGKGQRLAAVRADLRRAGLHIRLGAPGHHDTRPGLGQPGGHRLAQSAPGAGDDGDLARKIESAMVAGAHARPPGSSFSRAGRADATSAQIPPHCCTIATFARVANEHALTPRACRREGGRP